MRAKQNSEAIKKLEQIYDTTFGYLFAQGFMFCGDKNLTKDSIQELFLELCEKPHVIQKMEKPQAYLLTSLKRKILKTKNKEKSNTLKVISDQPKEISYEDLLIKSQEDEAVQLNIQKALASLSKTQRKVLKLRFYEGLSYEEIANTMNSSKRTVYNQVHEAIKRIRKYVLFSFALAYLIA